MVMNQLSAAPLARRGLHSRLYWLGETALTKMMTGLFRMVVGVSMAWGIGVCREAGAAPHRDIGLAVADLVLAHLFPEHLAADAQVLGRVLALPVVGVERRDDAVALVHVPVAAVGQQGLGGAGVRREGGGR